MSELQHFTQVPLECESTRGTLAFGLSEFQISDFYKIFFNKNKFTRKRQNPLPHQEVQVTSPTQETPTNTRPSGVHARELFSPWSSAALKVQPRELFSPWSSAAPRVQPCELFSSWSSASPRVHACELKRSRGNAARRACTQLREAATLVRIDRSCLAVERWPVSYGAIPPGLISRQNPTEPRPRRGVRCIWGEQKEGMAMT